jgi:hypothetical protein
MPTITDLWKTYKTSPDPAKRLKAARMLTWWLYWGPITSRLMAKLLGPVAIVPIPKPWPGPDPAPLLDADFLRNGELIRLSMGDPQPQPNILSNAEQLKAATEFRAAMDNALKALDDEIRRLPH